MRTPDCDVLYISLQGIGIAFMLRIDLTDNFVDIFVSVTFLGKLCFQIFSVKSDTGFDIKLCDMNHICNLCILTCRCLNRLVGRCEHVVMPLHTGTELSSLREDFTDFFQEAANCRSLYRITVVVIIIEKNGVFCQILICRLECLQDILCRTVVNSCPVSSHSDSARITCLFIYNIPRIDKSREFCIKMFANRFDIPVDTIIHFFFGNIRAV